MRKRILATRVQQVDQAVRLNIAQFLDRLAALTLPHASSLPTEAAIER